MSLTTIFYEQDTQREKRMSERLRGILASLGFYGLWGILAAFAVLAAYQIYVTLIFVSLLLVQNPATHPPGWNTSTIYGLGRFLVLVLGAFWLVAIALVENYLREGMAQKKLWPRALRVFLIIGALYGGSYISLFLL